MFSVRYKLQSADRAITQSLSSHRGDLGSSPGQCIREIWAEWHWDTAMLPEGQTDEASEPSTKRNTHTEIVERRTENYFDVCTGMLISP